MSSHRIVYHIKDKDLFDVFIRGLSHKVLLEPVRKDGELRNRYLALLLAEWVILA